MSSDHPDPTQQMRPAAPLYWECPGCGLLSPDSKPGAAETVCHDCGERRSGGPARQFPPERLRRLDERIRGYHRDGENEIVVILVASFLESLIEDILSRIMEAQGAEVRLQAAVLDAQRSIGQRVGRLFPALTGVEFEEVASQLGFKEFPRRWRRLRAERNAFIHDSTFEDTVEELTSATAEEAMALLDQAYRLFVNINNRFVSDVPQHKD